MAKKVHLNTKHNDKADLTIHSRQNIHKHTQERSYPALLLVLLKDLWEVLLLIQQSCAIWIKATILFNKTSIDQLSLLFLKNNMIFSKLKTDISPCPAADALDPSLV